MLALSTGKDHNGDNEIWRRLSKERESFVPDACQREVYGLQSYGMAGYFQPRAVLHIPELNQRISFRLPYPHFRRL